MSKNPTTERKLRVSLNKKYPMATVKIKLMPVAIGITREKAPEDSALNITNAERKITAKAKTTDGCNKNPTQSLQCTSVLPLRWYLITAAPPVLSRA
jgi:hypothetical protein